MGDCAAALRNPILGFCRCDARACVAPPRARGPPMSTRSSVRRVVNDHFEPDELTDPKAQRALRGYLESIDYTAYSANRRVMGGALAGVDAKRFEQVALATSQARALWVAKGIAAPDSGRTLSAQQDEEHVSHC